MPTKRIYTDEERRQRKNARSAERYRENKAAISAYHSLLHQSRKSDPEYMQKLRDISKAYRVANPQKVAEGAARRREANPEEARKRSREWFARNPEKRAVYEQNRRAKKRELGGKLSVDLKSNLLKLQKHKCACCKASLSEAAIHIDHIMPLALGGEHSDRNMQLLCQPCNQNKHAKHPVDFMQSRGFLL